MSKKCLKMCLKCLKKCLKCLKSVQNFFKIFFEREREKSFKNRF